MDRRKEGERGSNTFFRREFLVSLLKKLVGEPFSVSIILGIEIFYALEGFVTLFCQTFFVSQCPCWKNFWYRKMLGIGDGAGVTFFREKCFSSVSNHFVEELFCVSESLGYRKNLCLRGSITIFYRKIVASQYQ